MKLFPQLHLWLIPCSLLLLTSGEVQGSTGPTVTSLTLNPSKISGGSGGTSTGTVMLSGFAPVGGTLVALSSSNSALAAVEPSVTVPAGQSSATFTVWTNAGYRRHSGLSFAPVISASAGRRCAVTVRTPAIAAIAGSPSRPSSRPPPTAARNRPRSR